MILRRYLRGQATLTEVVIVILLLLATSVHAETTDGRSHDDHFITESGVTIGCGFGKVTEGQYQPVLLIWHVGWDLKKYFSPLEDHTGALSFFCEPQINPIFRSQTDVEFGIGFGLKYRYPLAERVSAYGMVSVGPHYITLQSTDQENGFLFADTAGGGLSFSITEKSALNLEYRFRHISNAELKEPNNGIDTHFIAFGYSRFF